MSKHLFASSLLFFLASCGGGSSYDKERDAVTAICHAYCDRGAECGAITAAEVATCTDGCTADLCKMTVCGADFTGDADGVDGCVDALDDHACSAETLPAECNDVL